MGNLPEPHTPTWRYSSALMTRARLHTCSELLPDTSSNLGMEPGSALGNRARYRVEVGMQGRQGWDGPTLILIWAQRLSPVLNSSPDTHFSIAR